MSRVRPYTGQIKNDATLPPRPADNVGEMKDRPKKINIYEFTDYREFLKTYYREKKRENKSFSFLAFARAAGIGSKNHLWQAMNGRRNLQGNTIRRFTRGLKLKKHEAEYFENLVYFNQAKTSEEKNLYYKKLASSKHYIEVRHIERDQYEYLSQWYYATVRELPLLSDFAEDPAWIANRLSPRITEKEAREAMELLFRLGFWCRDCSGKVVQAERYLSTANEIVSLAAANFHKQMIAKASEAIDAIRPQHREMSSLTVAVAREKVAEVKRRIQEFRRELHAYITNGEKADTIYQLNLHFFNLSEVPDEAC